MRSALFARCGLFTGGLGLACSVMGQAISPPFNGSYSFVDLGSVPGLTPNYGGLTLKYNDLNTLLIGGAANGSGGVIDSISVTRDGANHITGFSGTSQLYATSPDIDGGLGYGPGNVLFATGYPNNTMMEYKPGSASPDKVITLTGLGVGASVGSFGFVPAGFGGAGRLKILSYNQNTFYDATVSPDGTGTYDISAATLTATLTGGLEGFVYVPTGSPLFGSPSILVSQYGAGKIVAYNVDSNGDPIAGTAQDFMVGLSGAEGAYTDPMTGDFLFSTFGGGNHVIRVSGFAAPEPASMLALGLGALGLLRRRRARR